MTTRDESRLRDAHANSQQRIFGSNIFEDAASALEAKEAENARLTTANSELDEKWRYWQSRADTNESRISDLERQLAEETERCAQVAENAFGGKAHTYASENADLYRGQDMACQRIAAAIRGGAK